MLNPPNSLSSVKVCLTAFIALCLCMVSFAAKEVITAYVVKRGDTHASIAKKFGLTEKELRKNLFDVWMERGCMGDDYDSLRIANVLYIKHMDYSEEKKHDRMKRSAVALKTESVTREPQHQLAEKSLLKCERVFGQKISDEDFRAALYRFNCFPDTNDHIWSLREKAFDAEGRKEIYTLFNDADGRPDYALLFNGKTKSLFRIDEAQESKRIVTKLNVDCPRNVVDISDFKKEFKDADGSLVLTSGYLCIMCNRRYWQAIKIEERPTVVGNLYFGANIYETLKAICPNAINSYRVNIIFISEKADPVDLGCFYLDANVSRKALIIPMKKGLQEVVDRNWRLDRSSSRPASPPIVTDSEVRYLIDCPGHLKILPQ